MRQLPISIYDLRLSMTGELYRPNLVDLTSATKPQFRLELMHLCFGNSWLNSPAKEYDRRLSRMTRAELLSELTDARQRLVSEMESGIKLRARWEKFRRYKPVKKPKSSSRTLAYTNGDVVPVDDPLADMLHTRKGS